MSKTVGMSVEIISTNRIWAANQKILNMMVMLLTDTRGGVVLDRTSLVSRHSPPISIHAPAQSVTIPGVESFHARICRIPSQLECNFW